MKLRTSMIQDWNGHENSTKYGNLAFKKLPEALSVPDDQRQWLRSECRQNGKLLYVWSVGLKLLLTFVWERKYMDDKIMN